MISLAELPVEVLGAMLSLSSTSFLTLTLWQCGDSTLNRKLTQGVTKLDLKRREEEEDDEENDQSVPKLPSLLFQLPNLRHVSLDTGEEKMDVSSKALYAKLLELPLAQLETFELNCYEANAVFRASTTSAQAGLPGANDEDGGDRDDESEGYLFEDGEEPAEPLFDLNALFPKLTSLTLSKYKTQDSRDGYQCMAIQTIFECDMHHLPQSLTKLTMAHFIATENVGELFSKLPRTLEIWDTRLSLVPADNWGMGGPAVDFAPVLPRMWRNSPPRLHTLSYFGCSGAVWLPHLPKTLTDVQFQLGIMTAAELRSLPSGLRSLNIDDFDSEGDDSADVHWMKRLPASLTSICLGRINKGSSIDLFANLPRSLTSYSSSDKAPFLDYDELEKAIAESNSGFWPPGLVHWDFPEVLLPITAFKLLPRTLTDLTARCLLRTTFPANDLPRSLTSFTLCPNAIGPSTLVLDPGMPNMTSLTLLLKNVGLKLDEQSRDALPPSCKLSIQ